MDSNITVELTKAEADTLYQILIETPLPAKISSPLIAKLVSGAQAASQSATGETGSETAAPAEKAPARKR